MTKTVTPDLWHVGELPGDDGCVIRDENGLQVGERCITDWAAHHIVHRHNVCAEVEDLRQAQISGAISLTENPLLMD